MFKVGDKVKVVDYIPSDEEPDPNGRVGVVTNPDFLYGNVLVELDISSGSVPDEAADLYGDNAWIFHVEELELV